jgi:hypothetical protein
MKLRGMRGRVHARRALVGVLCAVVAFAASDIALVRVVGATQDDTQAANYGVYSGQVSATADHEQLGTSVDANFAGGAINNYYPLAYSNVAVAGTNALASWADTGPFAQAVFGGGLNGEVFAQPQYVSAQYPGTENPQPFTSPTGASASASVTSASARATSYAASEGSPPGAAENSAATRVSLETVLAQWKAKYFGAAPAQAPQQAPTQLPGLPFASPPATSSTSSTSSTSAPPDGTDGDTGYDSTYFDSQNGFVTTGSSRVHHASFGGGLIVIDNVRVDATVSNSGTGSPPRVSVSIQVGGATINGVPVTIGQNGVTVATQTTPTGQVQQASAALNQDLAASGFSIHLVTPLETTQGSSEHLDAVGVLVQWTQPAALTPGGVPSQFIDHYLGEVVLDNEASLASPFLAGGFSSSFGTTVSSTGLGGYSAGAPGTSSTGTPQHPTRSAGVRITLPRPLWLLLLYLAWQALVIGTAASVYLWRADMRSGVAAA